MKLKLLCLIILAIFAFSIVTDVNAGLRSEGKKALSYAKKLVKSSRATNEQIIAALKALETWSDKDITEFLVEIALPELMEKPDKGPAYRQALKTLEKMTDSGSQKYLEKQVFNKKVPGSLRADIYYKIIKEESTDELIIKGLEDEAWEVKQKALNFISDRTLTKDEFLPYLKTLIGDEVTAIRINVIIILKKYANASRKDREKFIKVAEILVSRLEFDKTRTRGDIVEALKVISETDNGDVYELWRNWLNKLKAGESITPDESKKEKTGVTGDFFGTETYSKRLIYIIDTSSSMEEDIDPELTKTAKKKAEETEGKQDKNANPKGRKLDWSKIRTKFDLAKAELIRSMWALPEPKEGKKNKDKYKNEGNVMFTIIAYNSDIEYWEEELILATEKNKVKAEGWINGLKTGKKTNIYGALNAGFSLAEGKLQKKKGANTGGGKDQSIQADTIFFLTDGYATTGRYFGGLDEILNVYDTNSDGKLTRSEFRKMFTDVFTEDEVMEMFSNFDEDKNGYITVAKGRNPKIEFDESVGQGGKQSKKAQFYYFQMEGMLREIAIRNEMLKIQVHTITVGKSSEADYTTMRKLAQMTGGEYVRLGAIDSSK